MVTVLISRMFVVEESMHFLLSVIELGVKCVYFLCCDLNYEIIIIKKRRRRIYGLVLLFFKIVFVNKF